MKRTMTNHRCFHLGPRGTGENRSKPYELRPIVCVLGLIDAALGRKEEALREGWRAVELLPVEKDSPNGTRMIMDSARSLHGLVTVTLACEKLARAIRLTAGPSVMAN